MKQLPIILTLSVLTMFASACEQERLSTLPPGKYEKTTTSTDSEGTTTKRTTSREITEDAEGKKKEVIKTKTTKDPKGLFNTKTVEDSKQVIEEEH